MTWHKLKDRKPKDGQLCLVWNAPANGINQLTKTAYSRCFSLCDRVSNFLPEATHWIAISDPNKRRKKKKLPPIAYGRKRND